MASGDLWPIVFFNVFNFVIVCINVMGLPQLKNATQWQITGIRGACVSLRQIARQVGHHHSTSNITTTRLKY